jgi:ubiquitin-conjugating enzyme E2 J1
MDSSVSQRPITAAVPATVSDQSPSSVAPLAVLEARTASSEQEASNTPAEFPRSGGTPSRSPQKPPVLLDTAIMILFVLLFAIICRKVV